MIARRLVHVLATASIACGVLLTDEDENGAPQGSSPAATDGGETDARTANGGSDGADGADSSAGADGAADAGGDGWPTAATKWACSSANREAAQDQQDCENKQAASGCETDLPFGACTPPGTKCWAGPCTNLNGWGFNRRDCTCQ